MSEEETELRVLVDREFYRRLDAVKKRYGVKTNAEMIRVLVSEKYNEIIDVKKVK